MLRSNKWRALQSRNPQLLFLDDSLKDEWGITLTAVAIGDTFMIEGSHVRKIRSKAQIKPKGEYRQLAVTEDEEAAIIRLIREGHSSGNYVTQRDVLNILGVQFEKRPTCRCVDYFMHRHADAFCETTLTRQENTRLQVPKQFLDDYIKLIKENMAFVPTELIFNLGEDGFSDWEERKSKQVLMPARFQRSVLHYLVNRTIRHPGLICCVTSAGDE
jgi:hypothetical protein